jgi:hypothetical protein
MLHVSRSSFLPTQTRVAVSPTWQRSLLHVRALTPPKAFIQTPWPVVRKSTTPTERPPLVGEVSANFCG